MLVWLLKNAEVEQARIRAKFGGDNGVFDQERFVVLRTVIRVPVARQ